MGILPVMFHLTSHNYFSGTEQILLNVTQSYIISVSRVYRASFYMTVKEFHSLKIIFKTVLSGTTEFILHEQLLSHSSIHLDARNIAKIVTYLLVEEAGNKHPSIKYKVRWTMTAPMKLKRYFPYSFLKEKL